MDAGPGKTPTITDQALVWLDKMKIAYSPMPDDVSLIFTYKGSHLCILNDCQDNELVIYAPILIVDSDDEKIQDMVYKVSTPIIERVLSPECEHVYLRHGLGYITQGYAFQRKPLRLKKNTFVKILKEMHDLQLEIEFILHCTHETMFNPPEEVMSEIFKDINNEETDGPTE